MSKELFLNYARKHFTVSVQELADGLYYAHSTVEDDELEEYIQRVLFTLLMYSYFAGGAALTIFYDVPYELFRREDYSPAAQIYLEEFVDTFFVSLERRLPREARKRFGNNIAFFVPPEVLMTGFANYASTLALGLARRVRIAKQAADVRRALDTLRGVEHIVAATEFTRGFTVGLLSAARRCPQVAGFLFSAILDERTSIYCRPRADMFIPVWDIEKLIRNSPPLHPNCRSVLIPVHEKVGREIDDLQLPQPPFYSPQQEFVRLALMARG